MPFKSFRKDIIPEDGPQLFYTAEANDVHIEIRASAFGDDNMSVGFSFRVGGADMAETGGLTVIDSKWDSEIDEGDEVWIDTIPVAFSNHVTLTALIRSNAHGATAVVVVPAGEAEKKQTEKKPATRKATASKPADPV